MKGVRLLNNGTWNKPPVLTAARRILVDGLCTHFQKCTLGEAAVFLNGTSYDIDQVSEFGNAPIIRISNITNPGSIYLRTNENLDHNFWVTSGELLVSWSASFKSIIWPGPEGYLNQHIFKVTERVGFDRRFIRHAIEASFDEMQEDVVGIGMMHLRRSDFLGHQIPRPPITMQRTIANFLDFIELGRSGTPPELPPILAEQRRIVARIEELAAKINEARDLRHQVTETEIPALRNTMVARVFDCKWPYVHLEKVCSLITDGTHQTPRYVDDGFIFLSAQNVKPFRFMPEVHRKVSTEDYRACVARAKPQKGDVLMTRVGAMIGEAAVIDRDLDFAFYVSLAILRPIRERIMPEFLVHWLNSPGGLLQSRKQTLGKGHSQGNLNLKLLRGFQVPLPALAEQHRIVTKLDTVQLHVDTLKKLQTQTAAELDALLPSILDKAFNRDHGV